MVGNSMEVLQKLKRDVWYDQPIPLLGIYPKKMKTLTWKEINALIFIAVFYNSQDIEITSMVIKA